MTTNAGRRNRLGAVCLAITLAAVGCAAESPTAEQQLCTSLDELGAAASALGTLSLGATRTDLDVVVEDVVTALQAVSDDLGAVVDEDLTSVQQSLDDVVESVRQLPAEATLSDAVETVRQALPALQTAVRQAGVDCAGGAGQAPADAPGGY
jgi:cytochrome c556